MLIRNVSKQYKNSKKMALREITVNFPDHGFIFIRGKSGAGKTTLLNILALVSEPTSGEIFFDDEIIDIKSSKAQAFRQQNISCIYQHSDLIRDLNVLDNLKILGASEDDCLSFLRQVRMEERMYAFPNELSGGEKQRVAIARGLIKKARIYIIDEPTSSLDDFNSQIIFDLLKSLSDKFLIIAVSHDDKQISDYADRIIKLDKGFLVDDISINEISRKNVETIHHSPLTIPSAYQKKLIVNYFKNGLMSHVLALSFSVVCSLLLFIVLTVTCYKLPNIPYSKMIRDSKIDFIQGTDVPYNFINDDYYNNENFDSNPYIDLNVVNPDDLKRSNEISVYIARNDTFTLPNETLYLEKDTLYLCEAEMVILYGPDRDSWPTTIMVNSGIFDFSCILRLEFFSKSDALIKSSYTTYGRNFFKYGIMKASTLIDSLLMQHIWSEINFKESYTLVNLYPIVQAHRYSYYDFVYFNESHVFGKNDVLIDKYFYDLLHEPKSIHPIPRTFFDYSHYDLVKDISEFNIVGYVDQHSISPPDRMSLFIADETFFNIFTNGMEYFLNSAMVATDKSLKYLDTHIEEIHNSDLKHLTDNVYTFSLLKESFFRMNSYGVFNDNSVYVRNVFAIILVTFLFLSTALYFILLSVKKSNDTVFSLKATGFTQKTVMKSWLVSNAILAGIELILYSALSMTIFTLTNAILKANGFARYGIAFAPFDFNFWAFIVPITITIFIRLVSMLFNYHYVKVVDISFEITARRK